MTNLVEVQDAQTGKSSNTDTWYARNTGNMFMRNAIMNIMFQYK